MRHLDARDVLKCLGVEDGQFAAVGGAVVDITHQHAVVLGGARSGRLKDELAQRLI